MQGRWLFPIKAAGTGTPTVFEKTPMSDGPMSTVRWVDMAVAPSGNVQLILDIFNKTGVPAYVSRLCSGGILSLRNHVAVDVVQFVSPVASVATRGRWSQALNESLPANEPSAVAPGVRERRVLKFADRLNPCVARTVRVLSAPRPGGDPIRVHQRGWRRQPASGAVRRSRYRNADGEHLPTHAGAASGFRRDAWCTPTFHVIHINRISRCREMPIRLTDGFCRLADGLLSENRR